MAIASLGVRFILLHRVGGSVVFLARSGSHCRVGRGFAIRGCRVVSVLIYPVYILRMKSVTESSEAVTMLQRYAGILSHIEVLCRGFMSPQLI
ncbi:hypothetical protein DSUL_60096 [Desulfovibrionales bacterium]